MSDVGRLWQRVDHIPESYVGIQTDPHGYVIDWDLQREVRAAQRAAQGAISQSLSIGGSRYDHHTLEAFDVDQADRKADRKAVECAQFCIDDKHLGLWLYGSVGRGKTHLAAAIANAHRATGTPAIIATVDHMLRKIRNTFDAEGDTLEAWVIAAYATCPVLAIDDFGKGSLTVWGANMLWEIVNVRYAANLPLLVTSNASPRGVALLYDRLRGDGAHDASLSAGLVDRIVEMTGEPIEMAGASRRGQFAMAGAR